MEYEYSEWVSVPRESVLEVWTLEDGNKKLDAVAKYRIATPKPKREFVVGKWYKPVATWREPAWVKCVAVEDGMGWLTGGDIFPAYRYNTSSIDWSVAPRDEHP